MGRRFFALWGVAAFGLGRCLVWAEGSDSYRLYARDLVTFSVYGENDLAGSLRVSGNGTIAIPLLGEIKVVGLTLAEAAKRIEEKYQADEILIRPQVAMQVAEYSKKEISILGQVGRQGKVEFPPESSSLTIVEAITAAGGFTRIGKGDSVRVTRKNSESGEEQIFVVDAERLISGKGGADLFQVLPGDVIFVPERLF